MDAATRGTAHLSGVIAHGIDLVEVERVARLVAAHGARFLERVFTPGEREHGAGSRRHAEHLAVRFAAKEAVLKALGTGLAGGIAWVDVEVTRDAEGRPGVRLHGAAQAAAEARGIGGWHLSLTHSAGLAAASVIATSGDGFASAAARGR